MKRNCSCTNMDNFIKVCLLTLLNEKDGYGYSLLEELQDFCILKDLNIGTLYRTLRKMENENLVETKWEQGQGPKKRIYTISPKGKEELSFMLKTIEQKKKGIEAVLRRNGRVN